MHGGTKYNRKNLLALVRKGESLFKGLWDVYVLIEKIKERLHADVKDIVKGVHFLLSNGINLVARLNVEDSAVHELLAGDEDILASNLLYHRLPVEYGDPRIEPPRDLAGRGLFVFEKVEGATGTWHYLSCRLLEHAARIGALLFRLELNYDFVNTWLSPRFDPYDPVESPLPITSSRKFCIAFLRSKANVTILNNGDGTGRACNKHTYGAISVAAKKSLLRLIPHILTSDTCDHGNRNPYHPLYRFVLEHGNFGVHNMTIKVDPADGLLPAILSDPLMCINVDFVADGDAKQSYIHATDSAMEEDHKEYKMLVQHYFEALYREEPDFKNAIEAGKDARHIWQALRDWHDQDPEEYFGKLGTWAEEKLEELESCN
ncbi:hypothetical protein B0J14DRAFT_623643 [Halenospora varia]|nr:hypothetical protein B0J14DRAFT_623643 [Halenospora varia]